MNVRLIESICLAGILACLVLSLGCESDNQWVDSRLNRVLDASSEDVGGNSDVPETSGWMSGSGTAFPKDRPIDNKPHTDNPPAADLQYQAQTELEEDADSIVRRMQSMAVVPDDAEVLTLESSIKFATLNSLDYISAEENYLIAGLALLIESHRWEPRFFNNFVIESELGDFVGLDGRFENALTVVNDFGVTQKLPYGGQVSASLLVGTTNLLDQFLIGDNTFASTADLVLAGDIPLLRGSGLAAREPLIQARRNLIYSARNFEEFRRKFYLDLVTAYLDLVVQQQSIDNARRSVAQFKQVESRSSALVSSGRLEPFQADLAKQDTLFEIDRLSGLQESYQLAVDRFKLLIGMNTDQSVLIERDMIALAPPEATPDAAVKVALQFRLDVQTARDQTEDLRRQVDIAKNGLLADLNLNGSMILPFADTGNNIGIDMSPNDVSFTVGATFSAPLDRVIEKYQLRQAQIRLEQGIRSYRNTRDQVAVEVRSRVRQIERSQFSVLLQERNVEIAENRRASIEAAPDRASTRDRTDAVNALRRAEDQRDRAARDLQVAILEFLAASGRLRVEPDGTLLPIPGMRLQEEDEEKSVSVNPDPIKQANS
ncbi:MAG: TolC family protein [Phycisphaerales bacterium]|nr:TolC family protein [Phycisphaerales bacterium]